MQLNKKNEFHFQPDWYRGIEYPKEQERGYDFNEDLYVPGYFEVDIKKGESVVFSAGISEISPRKLKQTFESEVADRTPRDSFYHCTEKLGAPVPQQAGRGALCACRLSLVQVSCP